MWCVPTITEACKTRLEDILDLYAKPYDSREPVRGFDEKAKQLLKDTRPIKNTREGKPRRRDDAYERNGTTHIFVAVEPRGGHREVTVTKHRKNPDVAKEITRIIELPRDRHAATIHLVLDHLNTHVEQSFMETFGTPEAARIMSRIAFHDTPKHASWLNMAEIEIGIFSKPSIRGRIPTEARLRNHARIWQAGSNQEHAKIPWTSTGQDARTKFTYNEVQN